MKTLLGFLLFIGVALAGTAYWYFRPSTPGEVPWPLQSLSRGTLVEAVSATGVLEPHEVCAVTSEAAGRIVEIAPGADYNRTVAVGQALVELDKTLARDKLAQASVAIEAARADVARAQAAREAAQIAFDRQEELVKKGGFQKDADVAKAQLRAAEVAVLAAEVRVKEAEAGKQLAETGLAMTTLKAPRAGVIVKRHESLLLGQNVSPLSPAPLLLIADTLQTMEIHVHIAEADISRVSAGNRATFTVNAYPNDVFVGKVTEKRPTPTSIQGAVYYTVIVGVDNVRDADGGWKLLPGMPASVDVIRREHADVWRVPTAALAFQPDDHRWSDDARTKLARSPGPDWRTVWVLDAQKRPTPLRVRVGGTNARGEEGFQDQQFTEVLEWDPDLKLDPTAPETWPRIITGPPPSGKPGVLEKGIKIY